METSTSGPSDDAIGCVCAVLFLTAVVFYLIGASVGEADIREEAVKSGAARWEADPKGNTHIKWLPAAEAQKP